MSCGGYFAQILLLKRKAKFTENFSIEIEF
jgi:hypothetical protein